MQHWCFIGPTSQACIGGAFIENDMHYNLTSIIQNLDFMINFDRPNFKVQIYLDNTIATHIIQQICWPKSSQKRGNHYSYLIGTTKN